VSVEHGAWSVEPESEEAGNLNRSPACAGRRLVAATKPEVGGRKAGVSALRWFGVAVGGRREAGWPRRGARGLRWEADGIRHTADGGRLTADGGRQMELGGFSLVEVTVAIGIFAFVVVGVLGLLPTALKLRAESAQETRAVLIAQELFSSVQTSGGVRAVVMRDGPGLRENNNVNPPVDLISDSIVIGYPTQTTVPFGLWHGSRGNDPEAVWQSGQLPGWAKDNDIQTLARLKAYEAGPNLYRVTCEVRSPASLPLVNSKPAIFQTYVYTP
jgi:type II secretory pathway pseudopilin PulG